MFHRTLLKLDFFTGKIRGQVGTPDRFMKHQVEWIAKGKGLGRENLKAVHGKHGVHGRVNGGLGLKG
jgi:hypothetical protein